LRNGASFVRIDRNHKEYLMPAQTACTNALLERRLLITTAGFETRWRLAAAIAARYTRNPKVPAALTHDHRLGIAEHILGRRHRGIASNPSRLPMNWTAATTGAGKAISRR
jgi:N-methylhydantoinase A/oxoprolinase/acetone carboxylase beta subunit